MLYIDVTLVYLNQRSTTSHTKNMTSPRKHLLAVNSVIINGPNFKEWNLNDNCLELFKSQNKGCTQRDLNNECFTFNPPRRGSDVTFVCMYGRKGHGKTFRTSLQNTCENVKRVHRYQQYRRRRRLGTMFSQTRRTDKPAPRGNRSPTNPLYQFLNTGGKFTHHISTTGYRKQNRRKDFSRLILSLSKVYYFRNPLQEDMSNTTHPRVDEEPTYELIERNI